MPLVREFRESFKITEQVAIETNQSYQENELLNIAYLSFYYGAIGEISSEILKSILQNESDIFVNKLLSTFEEKQKELIRQRKFYYNPFEGHQSRLGHYYRHLYQTTKYVDTQKININKYEYVKTLRAQLSNHEQVLFCYNILSNLGKNWIDEKLVIKYKMIKNIPHNLITEFDLKARFPELIFEWEKNLV
ncbi:hypothetical protein B6I21_03465 [candidate division KSB1 bacterium 4572_119]|nr:MAG: hypothetical protein B6I21_03465 [candidate division KSB1 bacterium 4572_119]